MGTDRLEFYFVHQFDPDTPIEETLRALDDLSRRGLILYSAVSNWAAWQIMKALGTSAQGQLARFELVQPMYNLSKRQAEVEILPLALSEELGVIPYSPLGGGLLTGKYVGERPAQGRLVENKNYTAPLRRPAAPRDGGALRGVRGRARRPSGDAGGRVGRVASGGDRADYRG